MACGAPRRGRPTGSRARSSLRQRHRRCRCARASRGGLHEWRGAGRGRASRRPRSSRPGRGGRIRKQTPSAAHPAAKVCTLPEPVKRRPGPSDRRARSTPSRRLLTVSRRTSQSTRSTRSTRRAPARGRGVRVRVRRPSRLLRYTLLLLGGAVLVAVATGAALWVTFARIIDERLAGGPPQAPRVYARPFGIRPGQALSVDQLVARLNEVGYAQREVPLGPGEFAVSERRVMLIPRSTAGASARPVTIEFTGGATPTVSRLVDATDRRVSGLTLEPALLAALAQGERRRHVPLRELPQHVIDAVLAIEDRRFFD